LIEVLLKVSFVCIYHFPFSRLHFIYSHLLYIHLPRCDSLSLPKSLTRFNLNWLYKTVSDLITQSCQSVINLGRGGGESASFVQFSAFVVVEIEDETATGLWSS
jgi:hypothetical protein